MDLGKFGEDKAAAYLSARGYTILCRNFRYRRGEIDIVARDNAQDVIIFFEVKTRRDRGFGLPCESVTALKLRKIEHAINLYTCIHDCGNSDLRVDVIEILLVNRKTYLRHLKNVF